MPCTKPRHSMHSAAQARPSSAFSQRSGASCAAAQNHQPLQRALLRLREHACAARVLTLPRTPECSVSAQHSPPMLGWLLFLPCRCLVPNVAASSDKSSSSRCLLAAHMLTKLERNTAPGCSSHALVPDSQLACPCSAPPQCGQNKPSPPRPAPCMITQNPSAPRSPASRRHSRSGASGAVRWTPYALPTASSAAARSVLAVHDGSAVGGLGRSGAVALRARLAVLVGR